MICPTGESFKAVLDAVVKAKSKLSKPLKEPKDYGFSLFLQGNPVSCRRLKKVAARKFVRRFFEKLNICCDARVGKLHRVVIAARIVAFIGDENASCAPALH